MNPSSNLTKMKKKRKRDEIEVEYENNKLYMAVYDLENDKICDRVGQKRKKLENLEDMMVSKEGFDDEDKLLRTVFVANLPFKVKKKVVFNEFGGFGEVESVGIRSVPLLDSNTIRNGGPMMEEINECVDSVHAYIVFKTVESARDALAHNMAVIGGNHIRVDRACPPHKKLKGDPTPVYDHKRTIFIGNLPFDVKDEELYQLFTSMKGLESSLEAVRVIRDPDSSLEKGIAYVLFKTKEAANRVMRKRVLRLRDRELRLSHVKLNSSPEKSLDISPGECVMSSKKRGFEESETPGSSNMQNHTRKRVNLDASNQKAEEPIERKRKSATLALRKAKALKSGSASKTSGIKRKLGNQTPESADHKKKARLN